MQTHGLQTRNGLERGHNLVEAGISRFHFAISGSASIARKVSAGFSGRNEFTGIELHPDCLQLLAGQRNTGRRPRTGLQESATGNHAFIPRAGVVVIMNLRVFYENFGRRDAAPGALRSGLDLERISQETEVSVRMLELIENDQFQQLPGAFFARSFVRQYARALGLDEEEFVRELDRTFEPPAQPPPGPAVIANMHSGIDFPRMAQLGGAAGRLRLGSWVSSLGMVVLVILACSAVYTRGGRRHDTVRQRRPPTGLRPTQGQRRRAILHTSRPAPQKNASMEAPAASVPPSAPAPAEGGVTMRFGRPNRHG